MTTTPDFLGNDPPRVEGLRLREALKLPSLRRARVIAGAQGIDRVVRHVNVMEVPDILAWVKPEQLLLTAAYPLRDERAALIDLVPQLAQKGLAALGVKPLRYVDCIPDEMIAAAEHLGFPLLELPPDTSFDDIINEVLSVILNAQALRLARSAAIHERFTRIVLGGGGLREIVHALAELIACPVVAVDPTGGVLRKSVDPSLASLTGRQCLWEGPVGWDSNASRLWADVVVDGAPRRAGVQVVRVGAEILGGLVFSQSRS